MFTAVVAWVLLAAACPLPLLAGQVVLWGVAEAAVPAAAKRPTLFI